MSKILSLLIIFLFFTAIPASLAANETKHAEVIATIKVGDGPMGIAYDPGTGEIYVANYGNPYATAEAPGSVSVISDMNNTVVATI